MRVVLLTAVLTLVGVLLVPTAARAADAGPITLGTPFTANLPAWTADDTFVSFSFTGTAGQHVVLHSDRTVGSDDYTAGLRGPHPDTDLGFYPVNPSSHFADLGVLTSNGTWHLDLNSYSTSPGPEHLTLSAVTDLTGSLTYGTPKTLNFTAAGQNAALTFSGRAGQALGIDVTASSFSGDESGNRVDLQLIGPDGTPSGQSVEVVGPQFWDTQLTADGTWTLRVDPAGANTGSITLTAIQPTDVVKTVTPGAATAVTYPGRGGNVRLKVKATAGQRLVIGIPASNLSRPGGDQPRVLVRLIDPTGRERNLVGDAVGPTYLEATETIQTGTWTVLLDPEGQTTGTQTVRVGLVTDAAPSPITLGAGTTVKVDPAGANPAYTFTGRAGQTVVLQLDPAKLTSGSWGGSSAAAGLTTVTIDGIGPVLFQGDTYGEALIPADGTYTLRVDPYQDTVGSATLTLRPSTATTQALRPGTATTVRIDAGNRADYTFTGEVGRRLALDVSALSLAPLRSGLTIEARLIAPDGSVFWNQALFEQPGYLESPPIDRRGRWTLQIDPYYGAAGTVTFTAYVPADVTGSLTPGSPVTATVRQPGQQARYTFRGFKNRRPTLDLKAATWTGDARYTLLRPDGTVFETFNPPIPVGTSGASWSELSYSRALDVTGTWTLVVDPEGATTGSQTFTLKQVQDVTGVLKLGKPVTANLPTRGQQAAYTFTWDSGDTGVLPWKVTGSTVSNGTLRLVAPNGWESTGQFGAGATADQSFGTLANVTGTWTVFVDPVGTATGKATLTLG